MDDYKKYSLGQLENFLHDCMNAETTTAQEIYDVIKSVVEDNYYTYKNSASQAYELLALLNGNGKGHIKEYDDCIDKILSCDKDDPSPECKGAWNDFWESGSDIEYNLREAEYYNSSPVELPPYQSHIGWQCMSDDKFNEEFPPKKDKVVKWVLPVQVDELTGDCYINLPDDLLEIVGLVEGDSVEWIDCNNGSFEMRKVNGIK